MKKFFKNLSKKISAYFERLAESNERLYGNKRLDCCDMNNDSNKSAQNKTRKVHNE